MLEQDPDLSFDLSSPEEEFVFVTTFVVRDVALLFRLLLIPLLAIEAVAVDFRVMFIIFSFERMISCLDDVSVISVMPFPRSSELLPYVDFKSLLAPEDDTSVSRHKLWSSLRFCTKDPVTSSTSREVWSFVVSIVVNLFVVIIM